MSAIANPANSPAKTAVRLGLVCMTSTDEVRFRAITRARFLSMDERNQKNCLRELYAENLRRLFTALKYCSENGIQLYRVLCGIFPLNDERIGLEVLGSFVLETAEFGLQARRCGIRVLMHPDQFVVLNSDKPQVVKQSIHILSRHAHVFDLLGLPRSTWSALIIHGGKAQRGSELVQVIRGLPENIRSRLVLENDERCYSAREILTICEAAEVPMVFDPHHHVIKEKLTTYEHPSVAEFVKISKQTWPDPLWHLAHISNGAKSFNDPHHSDLIRDFPEPLFQVPWVEVEAKGKQEAIFDLWKRWSRGDR